MFIVFSLFSSHLFSLLPIPTKGPSYPHALLLSKIIVQPSFSLLPLYFPAAYTLEKIYTQYLMNQKLQLSLSFSALPNPIFNFLSSRLFSFYYFFSLFCFN